MLEASSAGAPDRWRTAWSIENTGDSPMEIFSARLPHGKFHSEEKVFAPPVAIAPRGNGRIEIEARCGEATGAEVENGFLILRVAYAGEQWLILSRLRVRIDSRGTPAAATEL
ncbi:MAG TPA: hypothetical protein VGH16_01800, partial [Candidatus Binatia bacterium]